MENIKVDLTAKELDLIMGWFVSAQQANRTEFEDRKLGRKLAFVLEKSSAEAED